MARSAHSEKEEMLLLASLFIFESSLAVMAMATYIKAERPFAVLLSSGTGVAFLCAVAAFFLAGWIIVHQYLKNKRSPSRHFRMIVTMNLITVLLIVITGEVIVRAGSRSHLDGDAFMDVFLKPKNWEQAQRRYPQSLALEKSRVGLALMHHDDQLGWTVGSNGYSDEKGEGPYWSSAEGLRAPHEGFVYGKVEGKTDIALIGDSFTFGEEVRFEETWGYELDQLLGEEFRVLNFGVPGYGLGQMYLRYERDVRRWNPKIVILGFIDNDLRRTMLVYPFVSMGWSSPLSKPRFVLQDGELRNVNMPTIPPEKIFSHGSLSELPLLEYDSGYRPSDWQKRWYHFSYLIRLFISLYPPWSTGTSEEELLPLNAEILKVFVRSVKQAGSIPLIVYFPNQEYFNRPDPYSSVGKRVLQEAGLPYIDPTACLLEISPSVRYKAGGHYTREGNSAVGKCIYKAVKDILAQSPSGSRKLRPANDGSS